MRITKLAECAEFVAGDGCTLRELANAANQNRGFRYSLAQARVRPGQQTNPHRLRTSEAYYLIEGTGRMHIDQESADVGVGCFVEIPPMALQWIENIGNGDLVFLCIVDPGWRREDESLEQPGKPCL